jgi:hypothetical protein
VAPLHAWIGIGHVESSEGVTASFHQRNRITLSARELLQEGLIEYGGASLKILDIASDWKLAACEC